MNKDKHAYCIMAHKDPELLQMLINSIDDVRNDIFLHIDVKSDIKNFSDISSKKSILYWVQRCDVRWGDISQVKCELLLFKTARTYGPYGYYHLLSGADMPLKNQDEIHDFFQNNKLKEYVSIQETVSCEKSLIEHTRYYHLFTPFYQSRFKILTYILLKINALIILMQKVFHVSQKFSIELKKGHNWCSITNDFCEYILSNEKYIISAFKYVMCPDEIYKQSLLWNSIFKQKLYRNNCDGSEIRGNCLRKIDWLRGNPYVWTITDFDELISSNDLFARKFSMQNIDIVKKIQSYFS